MTASITFVTTCMGRLGHLRQTLPKLAAQPGTICLLVDYSCPERSGDWAEKNVPQVRVIRCPGETQYHSSRAKNIGATAVTTDWICLIDADIMIDGRFCQTLIPRLRDGEFFRGPPHGEGTSGTVVCRMDDFRRAGGYDEQMRGWGDDDADLFDSLRFQGVGQSFLPAGLVQHIDHSHEARMANFEQSYREQSLTVNRIYRLAKWDLARLHEHALTRAQCENLYSIVKKRVTNVWNSGADEIVFDTLHVDLKMGPWQLDRKLVYHLSR